MDPKWLIVEVVVQKDTIIGHISDVSHHLRSLLGVIEFPVLWH